jgi:predicted hotdog family 3-hydroxylacyl-ACP dehydratase
VKNLPTIDTITDFIPQRSPFVMVDQLIAQDKTKATSSFEIKEDNILVEENQLTVSGLLENIAQTAAANVGYECMLTNQNVPIGFIGAISKVKVMQLPKVNSSIETTIEVKHEIFDITLIEGEVKQNGEILISCQMKIMLMK